MRSIYAAAFVSLILFAQPAYAQDAPQVPVPEAAAPVTVQRPLTLEVPRGSTPQRALLLSMYAGNGALQGYDAYSTLKALKSGGAEANPVMGFATKSSAGLILVKVGMSAVTIYTAERLWRNNHRGHAIAVMLLSNGLMAIVAAHNHSVLQQLR